MPTQEYSEYFEEADRRIARCSRNIGHLFSVGLAVTALAALAAWHWHRGAGAAVDAAGPAVRAERDVTITSGADTPPATSAAQGEQGASVLNLPPEEPAAPGAPNAIDLARWERRFAEARPDLLKFKTLKGKVVRTAAENEALKKLLTDPAMVKTAVRDLLGSDERSLEDSRELLRIYQIDYLAMALGYEGNPNHDAALDAVMSVLRAENLPPGAPLDLRQSLAGDKLELMEALVALSPESAKEVVRSAKGTPLEPLLAEAETRGYGMVRFRQRQALSDRSN